MKNTINKTIAKFLMAVILVTGLSTLAFGKPNTQAGEGIFTVDGLSAVAHQEYLVAGDYTEITLVGDGYTDLDLYVYDAKGNLVAYSEGDEDIELIELEINRSETFKIVVVNRGADFNDYYLSVESY